MKEHAERGFNPINFLITMAGNTKTIRLFSLLLLFVICEVPMGVWAHNASGLDVQSGLQDIKISGIVIDGKGEPVVGAAVMIKGTTTGVATDLDGKFTIDAPLHSVLTVSYMGYKTREVTVTTANLTITLESDSKNLDEVVVVGYGTQKKVNLTGSVSTVKMDDVLGSRPVGDALTALEGAVSGLQINKNSGKPGVIINTNIRGVTSINGGSPLVLVDNVPMDLNMVDPNDIESISVLKDAAASAIYGARAAFGVILVTTKQGKKDTAPRFTYSNNFAFSTPATLPKMASPRQTLDAFKDMGIKQYYAGHDIEKWSNFLNEYHEGKHEKGYVWDNGVRYNLAENNLYDDMMDDYGFQHQHNLSVQGGGEKATYRISMGMISEDGILVTDKDRYKRYNVSSFVSMDAASWLTAQMDLKYANANMTTATGGFKSGSGRVNPWWLAHNLSSMSPNDYGTATENSTEILPFGTPGNAIRICAPNTNRYSDLRALGRFIVKPLKGWDIIGEYSYNRTWDSERKIEEKVRSLDPVENAVMDWPTNWYSMQQKISNRNAINIFSTYQKSLGDHDFTVMAGFNQENYYEEKLFAKRFDLISQGLPSISQSTGTMEMDDEFKEYALRSLFYRVNYSYKDKYLVEANGRYDGSSRFTKNDRFGFFPSFSAAWRLSEEKFMESTRDVLNNLKLRASWGNIGNQNTGNYDYMPIMDSYKPKWIVPGGDDFVTSIKAPGLVGASFTWETVETVNVGIDALFFNRLNISADYYIRDTKDMLAPAEKLPGVLGTTAPKINAADLRTKGWELTVDWKDKIGEVTYSVGFNLYDSRSEITRYENPAGLILKDDKELQLRKGMEYGEIWGYETERYFNAGDFDANGKLLPDLAAFKNQNTVWAGDIKYVDQDNSGEINDGDNTISKPGDLKKIGNNTPRYQYGINGAVQYKNFDFSFFFNGVGKRDLWIDFFSTNGKFVKGFETYQLDYWTADRTDGFYPRVWGNDGEGTEFSKKRQTKYLMNGAYFRLKNVTLGYSLPKDLCEKIRIQNLRIFVTGENLFTYHHLPKGYYPDTFGSEVGKLKVTSEQIGDSQSGTFGYPLMRKFAFGINLTF